MQENQAGKKQNFIKLNTLLVNEISNPGHGNKYTKFKKKQISSLFALINKLRKKYYLKNKNILGHSDIAPDRKKDPGEKFPWKLMYKKKLAIWHNLDEKKLKNNKK